MRTPSVHIIFPPQFEPFQAYLSGAYLKSLLGAYGISASTFDANIEFYEWLIACGKKQLPWRTLPDENLDYLRENIDYAISCCRTAPGSLLQYRWAINVIDQYLHAISPRGVRIGLTYLKVGN